MKYIRVYLKTNTKERVNIDHISGSISTYIWRYTDYQLHDPLTFQILRSISLTIKTNI
jgi:hypothetical protein